VFGHCADEEELAYVLREWNAEVDSVNDLRVEDELLVKVLDTGDVRLFSVNLAFSSMSMKLMTDLLQEVCDGLYRKSLLQVWTHRSFDCAIRAMHA
jgi:hypothetical protein